MTTKPKRPRGRMTAAEHEAWLKETGQYAAVVERQRQQEEERLKREAEYRRAEQPLLEELHAAGFQVNSAWDFVNSPNTYSAAIPILLAHLPRPYPAAVREGIARALAVREASRGWEVLIRLYREEHEVRSKDGLAVAIAAASNDELIDDVIALAKDKAQGPSRVLLLGALARSAEPRARAALSDLASDPDLTEEIQIILRRLKRVRR